MNSQLLPVDLKDEYGNVFFPAKKLAEGGQGAVYRLTDPDYAVKIIFGNVSPASLHSLRFMPIPRELPVTTPLSVLSGIGGYTMKLLKDMKPLADFRKEERRPDTWQAPSHMQEWEDKDVAWSVHQYAASGGLRKRLEILSSAATSMARLHAEGLCYGDISPNNLFYSPLANRVWWIDPDNIRFDNEHNRKAVYTPHYGAPEIVRGAAPASCAGDVFSFAVLAHVLLTDVLPFDGPLAEEASDWADTAPQANKISPEEKMQRGEFPWIFDEEDTSNALGVLLGLEVALGNYLIPLMAQTFGVGRMNPDARPTMHTLAHGLLMACMDTVRCSNPVCGMSWFSGCGKEEEEAALICPFCGCATTSYMEARVSMASANANRIPLLTLTRELASHTHIVIPEGALSVFSPADCQKSALSIERTDTEIKLALSDETDGTYFWLKNGGMKEMNKGKHTFSISDARGGLELLRRKERQPDIHILLTFVL